MFTAIIITVHCQKPKPVETVSAVILTV